MELDCLVGFRFKPTNEEIIRLLKKKRLEPDFSVPTVKEIDFYNFDPWELPRHSEIESKELVWYFYCRPYYKYARSKRSHRRTNSGCWKITGKGSDMKAKNNKDVIGRKRILSFFLHDATILKEAKPEWVMHEIYIEDDPHLKEDFVVCRLERKRDNKPRISTGDDTESSHLVVAEDANPKSVLPPNQVDDLINSPKGVQNEYSCEEIAQTLTPEYNYSKSDGNEMNDESIGLSEWVNTLFVN